MRDVFAKNSFSEIYGDLTQGRCQHSIWDDNGRLGRVPNYRRVFAHPAAIFFERNIASLDILEMSSLSAEPFENSSFICSVFEVPKHVIFDTGTGRICEAFREREEEFHVRAVPFEKLDGTSGGTGLLCCRSTDESYIKQWGSDRFDRKWKHNGITTIWNWKMNSGLKPCPTYLRHCILAADNMGKDCSDSFPDGTLLVDRITTIREYMASYGERIMGAYPPDQLKDRYNG